MGYGIDRRPKYELFTFLIINRDFFEDISSYKPKSSIYRDLLLKHINDDWQLIQEGIYYQVLNLKSDIPDQGFKIHISAVSTTAEAVLEGVVPECVKRNIGFKIFSDPFILDLANSKTYPRSSSGKFVTIYPPCNETFKELLEALYEKTQDLDGAYILSDKPYKDSNILFYRYGGFKPRFKINVYGERYPIIFTQTGEAVADIRTPFFSLPEGVVDPFVITKNENETLEKKTPMLKDRYTVTGSLRFSNAGGVYKAKDEKSGRNVVIKEARPFVNTTQNGKDNSITILKKEYEILQILQPTGYVPEVADFFQEWKHMFLVEEHIEGVPLSSFRALNDLGLVLQRNITVEKVQSFCRTIKTITSELIKIVDSFHQKGIIVGDLSPANIMVDTSTLKLTLIDFEGAFLPEQVAYSPTSTITTGYVSENRLLGHNASISDDYYSLACTIYSLILPIQECFQINPAAKHRFLNELVNDYCLPKSIQEIIFLLMEGKKDVAVEILESKLDDEISYIKLEDASLKISRSDLEETTSNITSYILKIPRFHKTNALWPADCRIYTTNPLNIAYGALGNAVYLQEVYGSVPSEIKDWINKRNIDTERYTPSLYIGLSGIAWAMSIIGLEEKAIEIMDKAYSCTLPTETYDIFYGLSGMGLASLYFWTATKEDRYLSKACEFADRIVHQASIDDAGDCYWLAADNHYYYGYAHGNSGICLFLLYLYTVTSEKKYLEYAVKGIEYEIKNRDDIDDYSIWLRSSADRMISPYWRYGSGGLVSVLIRFFSILKDEKYKNIAERGAKYLVTKYGTFPGQFIGLSGIGESLIDMYIFTKNEKYIQDAFRVAEGVLLFKVEKEEGIVFPGDELVRLSTDYGTGSAGIGMFFSRLLDPKHRLFHDLELP